MKLENNPPKGTSSDVIDPTSENLLSLEPVLPLLVYPSSEEMTSTGSSSSPSSTSSLENDQLEVKNHSSESDDQISVNAKPSGENVLEAESHSSTSSQRMDELHPQAKNPCALESQMPTGNQPEVESPHLDDQTVMESGPPADQPSEFYRHADAETSVESPALGAEELSGSRPEMDEPAAKSNTSARAQPVVESNLLPNSQAETSVSMPHECTLPCVERHSSTDNQCPKCQPLTRDEPADESQSFRCDQPVSKSSSMPDLQSDHVTESDSLVCVHPERTNQSHSGSLLMVKSQDSTDNQQVVDNQKQGEINNKIDVQPFKTDQNLVVTIEGSQRFVEIKTVTAGSANEEDQPRSPTESSGSSTSINYQQRSPTESSLNDEWVSTKSEIPSGDSRSSSDSLDILWTTADLPAEHRQLHDKLEVARAALLERVGSPDEAIYKKWYKVLGERDHLFRFIYCQNDREQLAKDIKKFDKISHRIEKESVCPDSIMKRFREAIQDMRSLVPQVLQHLTQTSHDSKFSIYPPSSSMYPPSSTSESNGDQWMKDPIPFGYSYPSLSSQNGNTDEDNIAYVDDTDNNHGTANTDDKVAGPSTRTAVRTVYANTAATGAVSKSSFTTNKAVNSQNTDVASKFNPLTTDLKLPDKSIGAQSLPKVSIPKFSSKSFYSSSSLEETTSDSRNGSTPLMFEFADAKELGICTHIPIRHKSKTPEKSKKRPSPVEPEDSSSNFSIIDDTSGSAPRARPSPVKTRKQIPK